MPTICVTPPAFGARAKTLDDLTGTWWVAQVRPQYERALARRLFTVGVDYFLPTETVIIRRGGIPRIEKRLTLPGYVFVNGDVEARYQAARAVATLRIIEVLNQDRLTHELKSFEWIMAEAPHVACAFTPAKGMRCQVRAGHPLEGHEAWIDDVKGSGRVIVKVTMIGEGTPVEIDPDFLEPLN